MVCIQCRDVTFRDIQAIVFDKDGTLADSQDFMRNLGFKRARLLDAQIPGAGEALLVACGIEGDRVDPTGLMAVGSRHENEIAAAAFVAETGRSWWESLAVARKAFAQAERAIDVATPSPLFVGSLDVLQNLADAGLKLGILSADTPERVQQFVREHQLDRYIRVQMGVDLGPSKPDPVLFERACASLGVSPHEALMVGDSPLDIEMAKKANAAGCIGICWESPIAAHLQTADVTIAQLDEIRVLAETSR
ncbi:MAG: HAD family hydrolase [Cyanobacteria bacterium SID2]|nr:HAD family hydrolase [Cyanobacteria bacterium SID2]MBP0005865.1 HAD family hydrolase [Cyanobacteria bacterium SBC]